jgi:hypothetical protein
MSRDQRGTTLAVLSVKSDYRHEFAAIRERALMAEAMRIHFRRRLL